MANLLEQAINTDDSDRAAKIIQDALGIESDDVVNYTFPKTWPEDREQQARIIGDWLQTGRLGGAEPCAISYYSSALWRRSARFASAAAV